jgi:penicillin-binding protein 2
MRLSVIGVIVIALFSALFVRLWFLQVAEGGELAAAASDNRERIVYEPATRGRILDALGRPLVDNTVVAALTFDREADLSERETRQVVNRVAEVTQTPAADIEERINDLTISQYQPVPIAVDVPIEQVQYVAEHREEFPGVAPVRLTERTYPNRRLASHVLGYISEISPEELEVHEGQGYRPGDLIGKSGVEQMFEAELRGEPRVLRLEVDNTGLVEHETVLSEGTPGNDVQLTINLDVQRVAEESLQQGREGATGLVADNTTGLDYFEANGGTVVVLDARNGSVVAMASGPDFDPADVADGLTEEEAAALQDEESNFLLNRAVAGQYAPGSTWKPFSAIAGLESGIRTPGDTEYDEGCTEIAGETRCNAGEEPKGVVDMGRSLSVSSDVYYYQLGNDMWQYYCVWTTQCTVNDQEVEQDRDEDRAVGYAIQDTARVYGFGEATGLGLSGEPSGRIPDQVWKEEFNRSNPDPESQAQNRLWLPGDSASLAIGQGDLLVTPIQLAVGYTAIANGGTLFTPRLASAIREPATGEAENGDVITELQPQPVGKTRLSDAERQVIIDGLIGAASDQDGTAFGSFSDFERGSVCGKTGTSQTTGKQDSSLFVGIVGCTGEAQYVALSIVEQGGFGADVAAPIIRRVIDALNGNPDPPAVVVNPAGGDEED